MRVLRLTLALSILLASTLPAQTRSIAERLGYPADAKLLILHADDLGVAHSEDAASFDALNRGAITSASVMMPTPWVTEVAAYFKAHPNADLGLAPHADERVGDVSLGQRRVEGQGAEPARFRRGRFRTTSRSSRRGQAGGGRAGASRAGRARVGVGHSPDAPRQPHGRAVHHAGAGRDVREGRARLSPSLSRGKGHWIRRAWSRTLAAGCRSRCGGHRRPQVPNDQVEGVVPRRRSTTSSPGITEIIVHLGHDDSELQAVTVNHDAYGAAWRQRDYDVVTSPEFAKALKDHNVIVVKWKDLYRAAQMK